MNGNIKRVVSALLTLSLVFGMLPLGAFAEEVSPSSGSSSQTEQSSSQASVSSLAVDENTDTTPDSNSNSDSRSASDSSEVTPTPTPAPSVDHDGNIYVSNYAVVDNGGNVISKLTPGSKGIVAVTVIDERIPAEMFPGVSAGSITGYIHATMTQGSFTGNNVSVRMRAPVRVGDEDKICYTVEFRDVTYVGGENTFSFVVGYSREGSNGYDVVPFAVEQKLLSVVIAQAVDDVPAPNIILTGANYGGNVEAGATFTLSTVAQNTSDSLELDNVTVKLVLPQGLSIAGGNNQYLIGKVGKKGTVKQAFTLKSDAIQTESTTMPVTVQYTFEALVNGKRTTFTSDQQISINVTQPTRFTVSSVDYSDTVYVNEEGYCTVNLVNKGKSTVYNVTVEMVSDFFTPEDVDFVGNMNRGTQNESEISFRADTAGSGKAKIVVTYEDMVGEQYKIEKEITVEAMENRYNDPGFVDPMPMPEEPEKKSNTPIYIGVGAAAVAIAGAVIYFKKKKAKRLAELEDEDEDI